MWRLQLRVVQHRGLNQVASTSIKGLQHLPVQEDFLVKNWGAERTGLRLFAYPLVSGLTVLAFDKCKLGQSGRAVFEELIKSCKVVVPGEPARALHNAPGSRRQRFEVRLQAQLQGLGRNREIRRRACGVHDSSRQLLAAQSSSR
jgi:hypothetical protein